LQSSRAEAWGSGKPYCEALAHEGAAVVVADIDGHAAQQVADGMRLGAAPARSAQIGVSKPEDVASLVGTFRAPRYLVREPAPCFPVRFRPKGGCLNARTSPFSGFAFGFQPRIEPVEIDHHSV
jgi:NAD(P)-dependent dehydrogenase (short-subunit alcohol dehydrogenase family)